MKKKVISFIAVISLMVSAFGIVSYGLEENRIYDIEKKYELYGENDRTPDKNEKANAERTVRKLKEANDFMKKIASMNKNQLDEMNEMSRAIGNGELSKSILGRISNLTRSATLYFVHVPLHTQLETYWCGPASGQQTIDSWIYNGLYSGSLPSQATLASMMSTTSNGTGVYNYRDGLNEALDDDYYISYKVDTSSEKAVIKIAATYSGNNNTALTYLVLKDRLDYYSGTAPTGHFISGEGILDFGDYNEDILLLMDCHYSTAYSGYHEVEFNQMYTALKDYADDRGVANLIY